jgi:hypothetical protein
VNGHRNDAQSSHPDAAQPHLPVEPGSTAELLAATHLFMVELLTQTATPWSGGADGLEHRRIDLELRLVEPFKGTLGVKPGEAFAVAVEQRREKGLRVTDYHGFWSHAKATAGARYLVVAGGASDAPAVLMQEPAIQQLLDAGMAQDVKGALAAEEAFAPELSSHDAAKRRAAAHGMLELALQHRAAYRGLFARYLWARIDPIYTSAEDEVLPGVFDLIGAKDATPELRSSLIADVYAGVLALGPTPERCARLLKQLFGVLLQPEAAPLHDYLLQVPIYNLIFQPGARPLSSSAVVPAGGDRDRLKTVVAGFRSSQAREILTWLAGG